MKTTFFIIYLLLIISVSFNIYAQDSSYTETSNLIDDLLPEPDEEADNSGLYDELESLNQNPIDINTAAISDLQAIPYIDLSIAKLIVSHREKFGKFFSKNELFSIKEIPNETVEKILPFVSAGSDKPNTSDNENISSEGIGFSQGILSNSNILFRSRLTEKIQDERGFTENKYLGSKYRIYNKLIARYSDKIQLGLVMEKDAGEKEFNDFLSFHLFLKDYGILKAAVAGDYLVQFGQGLAMSSPFGFSKGADAVYPLKRKGKYIKPYTSALENNFNRGAALSIGISDFTLTSFVSKNKFDANIDSISGYITSMPVDGYHRTIIEFSKRKTATETLIGSSLIFNSGDSFEIGALYFHSRMSNSLSSSSLFSLSGTDFSYSSFYYDVYFNNFNITGESAFDGTSVASVIMLQLSISRNFTFVTSIRTYPHNYKNLHGFGFGEKNGTEQNEVGFYNGFKWRTQLGTLNFYFDQFKFPFASYSIPLPAHGYEFLINFVTKPVKNSELRLRYKNENKEQLAGYSGSVHDILAKRLKENYRLELIFDVSKKLKLKERIEYCRYNITDISVNEEGYLVFQDVRFRPIQDLTLYLRIAFFNTSSFNSAVYTYENDLNGILSSTSLYGQGLRWYLIVKYRFFNRIILSAKYSETFKPDVKSFGTGYSEINGNVENRLGIQLDIDI